MTSNHKPDPFTLTEEQRQRLLLLRARRAESEDEESLEWFRMREQDVDVLREIKRLLTESRFATGSDLNYAQMARLLALVRSLAPNPNLDRRVLHQSGEPGALNRDLRDWLYGSAPVPVRLERFLARRHIGVQTALQWLCAVYPQEWPLVTQGGLRFLQLSPEQHHAAVAQAHQHYPVDDVHAVLQKPIIWRLLASVEVYRAVQEVLHLPDFVAVHRLLTQDRPGTRRARRALSTLIHAPITTNEARAGYVPSITPHATAENPVPVMPEAPDIRDVRIEDVLRALEAHIAARGFAYPSLTVRTYYLCLQTRPLVLLSGLSGTGKTHLTFLLAEALTGNTAEQYRLIPVRPDWVDSSPLLGYVNYLARGGEGRYILPPFLQFLQRASRPENAHRAFFLCLDEMNLGRTEHYLAEVLSAMEAPTRTLLLPDGTDLRLPSNLFLTGTLNLDEATHPLSRKTLDRASVLTFPDVCLEAPAAPTAPETGPPFAVRQAVFLHTRIQDVQEARDILTRIRHASDTGLHRVLHTLSEAHRLLGPHGLSFAYRVRDDALRFCARSFDRNGQGLLALETPDDAQANLHIALDLFLVTRVLPRLSGPIEQMDPPARELLQWATGARFHHTTTRLERFLHRLQRAGFASMDDV